MYLLVKQWLPRLIGDRSLHFHRVPHSLPSQQRAPPISAAFLFRALLFVLTSGIIFV